MMVRTNDDTLIVFQDRDLRSAHIAQLPMGAELTLGHRSAFDGRLWAEAILADGLRGYVLWPSAVGHTSAGFSVPARAADPLASDRLPEVPRESAFLRALLVTTGLVWVAILVDLCYLASGQGGWGSVVYLFLLAPIWVVGALVNLSLGAFAANRGNPCGWPVALSGLALWLVTIWIFFAARR